MTEKSRTTDELVGASVESDGFIDAVLEVATSAVAIDMIDGELLSTPAAEPEQVTAQDDDELVVDLRDGAAAPEGPVAKATSRSAATAKAKQVKPKQPAQDAKPAKAKQVRAKQPAPKSKPVKTKPVKPKAAQTKPAQSKPAKAKPVVASQPKPAQSKPAQSKPAQPKPVLPKTAPSKPELQPVDAEERVAAANAVRSASTAGAAPRRALVVDYRSVGEAPVRTKRRSRPLRRLRRAFREYRIRRASGAARVPLLTRWRKARLRRMRAQRRAATQAALLGQDPAEVSVRKPNVVGYAVAVLVIAAIVVAALLLFV